MKGDGIGEDILNGLKQIGREAVNIVAPIARDTFKRKVQQKADQYIESGKRGGRRKKGEGIGEDILRGLKQIGQEAVNIVAPIARDTFKRKVQQKADQYIESGKRGGRRKKGEGIGEDILNGLKQIGREAIDIVAPIARDTFKRKVQQKADQYIESGKGGGSIRLNMSAAQARTFKKGGAIQLRPDMLSDLGRYAMELNPVSMANLTKKIRNDRGMRLSPVDIIQAMDMKRGGMMELNPMYVPNKVRSLVGGGDSLGPMYVPNKVKRLLGRGREPRTFEKGKMYTHEVRPGERGMMPVKAPRMLGMGPTIADIPAMFRKKHGGKKGKGPVEDFFNKTIPQFVTKTLPRAIRENVPPEVIRDVIDEAVPVASAVIGSTIGSVGGPAGTATGGLFGKAIGDKLAKVIRQKAGVGLYAARRGMGLYAVGRGMGAPGVIQTGSPYIDHRSPAYHPFKEKVNPFT